MLFADAGVRTGSSKITRSTCKIQNEKKDFYNMSWACFSIWRCEYRSIRRRSTCKTFPTEGRSHTWTALHRKLMIQMHSYGDKKWERPSDEWGDNWEQGKDETMLTAVSQKHPPDLHSKIIKLFLFWWAVDEIPKWLSWSIYKISTAKVTVFHDIKSVPRVITDTDLTMDAIKKKMQAMKIEKDNAMDRADQCEQAAKAAKVNLQNKYVYEMELFYWYTLNC